MMARGTRFWRLAGVVVAAVAVVVAAIAMFLAIMMNGDHTAPAVEPQPRPAPTAVGVSPQPAPVALSPRPTAVAVYPRPTTVALAPILTHGHYRYDSRGIPGRFLHFFVPDGLQLMMGWEGDRQSEQSGLVLFTLDGQSWICLSVLEPVECGRGVDRDADGVAELFDIVLELLRYNQNP